MAIDIEFVIVHLNKPVDENCAACGLLITNNEYTRDWPTKIVYHNRWCRSVHIESAIKALERPKNATA